MSRSDDIDSIIELEKLIAEKDAKIANMKEVMEAKDASIVKQMKEIDKLKKSFLQTDESRRAWLSEFDNYRTRLAAARVIIRQFVEGQETVTTNTTACEWLQGKP
jgi:hypothetical protein